MDQARGWDSILGIAHSCLNQVSAGSLVGTSREPGGLQVSGLTEHVDGGFREEGRVSSPWRGYGWQLVEENFRGAGFSANVCRVPAVCPSGCWDPVPASWDLPPGRR